MKKYGNIAELLTEYREHKGLTQVDLAALLDVDSRSIMRWEKGLTQVSRNSEADFARKLSIPFQVIRNLNSDPPITIYYDLDSRLYAHTALGTVISSASFFKDEYPEEEGSVKPINTVREVQFAINHHNEGTDPKPEAIDLLMRAAKLLPDLNLISLDQSMYFSGYVVTLPLKNGPFEALLNNDISLEQLTTEQLQPQPVENPCFLVVAIYADSIPAAYYLMRPFFDYFRTHKFPKYKVAALAPRAQTLHLWQETGLKVKYPELVNEYPVLVEGDFDMFLFGKAM